MALPPRRGKFARTPARRRPKIGRPGVVVAVAVAVGAVVEADGRAAAGEVFAAARATSARHVS